MSKFTVFFEKSLAIDRRLGQDAKFILTAKLVGELSHYVLLNWNYDPPSWLTIESFPSLYRVMAAGSRWEEAHVFREMSEAAHRIECIVTKGQPDDDVAFDVTLKFFKKERRVPFGTQHFFVYEFEGQAMVGAAEE